MIRSMMSRDGYEFITTPSVIFRPQGDWIYGREPLLRRMPDGTLCCLIYSGGPREPDNANVVLITRSDDDGESWSAPQVLFQHPSRGAWATELFTEGERPCIFLHTLQAESHYLELNAFRAFYDAATGRWSMPVSLPGGFHDVIARQGIVLQDGSWLFPVYWQEVASDWAWAATGGAPQPHDGFRFRCGVMRSEDQGQSFSLHGNIAADCDLWEPNAIEVAPNRLLMLLRAEGVPVLYRADSADGGRSWSAPYPTTIPSANSKLTLLKHGDAILLLHNPSDTPGWYHRTSLQLWISRDGGESWPTQRELVRATGEGQVICYPHAFIDQAQQRLYIACDTSATQYLLTVPLQEVGL